ncbi:hypothetical protein OF83DRAFT_1080147 [Amylostereum chailletii]|nr:hypothetical protein OF83DRAFT_1080147 [Amylostereum chailletii]
MPLPAEGEHSAPKKRGRPKGSKNKIHPTISSTSDGLRPRKTIPTSRQPIAGGQDGTNLPSPTVPPLSHLPVECNFYSLHRTRHSQSSGRHTRPYLSSQTTPLLQRYQTVIKVVSWDSIVRLPLLPAHKEFSSSSDIPISPTEAHTPTHSDLDSGAGPSKKRPARENGDDSFTASASQPPAKRARTCSSLYRHPRFWFEDGSVVLSCESVFFLVHKTLLERRSGWFSTWFSQKEDQEADHPADSCTIFHDEGLDPEDFGHLLGAVYDGIDCFRKSPPFSVLDSLLRISYNLGFNNIGDWAKGALQDVWYTELHDFDSKSLPYAAESITLARNLGILGVTKRAFVELLRSPDFASQVTQGDEDEIPHTVHSLLTTKETANLIHAREKLLAAWIDNAATMPAQLAQKCAHLDGRTSEKMRPAQWLALVHESGIFKKHVYDPINGLYQLCCVDWSSGTFCPLCVDAMKDTWENERERLWRDVDVWLGL